MKKLKIKVFTTIFLILSISMLTILCLYNSINYYQEKKTISLNLERMIVEGERMNLDSPKKDNDEDLNIPKLDEPKRFMDVTMYTVILNHSDISHIISHTRDENVPSEIEVEASKILKQNSIDKIHIGNLFLERYSYRYEKDSQIIILDHLDVNHLLRRNFLFSFLIFLIFEVFSFFISTIISKWIIEPVEVSFRKQKQFIADASHELKTPLSVIMASADALENDGNQKWLANIQSEANRMSHLIKSLLDLAKLENEDISVSFENQNLSKVIELAILPFESLAFEKNVILNYDLGEDISFSCQVDEIKQLVAILMDNAVKHSRENGTISVFLKQKKDNILFQVINMGDEIPKGEEEKIFERFYRIDKARNRNENRYGLGLAIAKSIVLRHHGEIRAYSHDEITTFEVLFKR